MRFNVSVDFELGIFLESWRTLEVYGRKLRVPVSARSQDLV